MAALVGGRLIIVNSFFLFFSFLQVLSVFKARQHTHTHRYIEEEKPNNIQILFSWTIIIKKGRLGGRAEERER